MKIETIGMIFSLILIFSGLTLIISENEEFKISPNTIVEGNIKVNTNLTMTEFVKFIKNDKTNEIITVNPIIDEDGNTIYEGFVCYDYVRMLESNAENEGINMGTIYIRDTPDLRFDTLLHTINYVFIDGVMYCVEPQTDEIFTVSSIKDRYNSNYVTVMDINDKYYPRQININKGAAINFRNDVDYYLGDD